MRELAPSEAAVFASRPRTGLTFPGRAAGRTQGRPKIPRRPLGEGLDRRSCPAHGCGSALPCGCMVRPTPPTAPPMTAWGAALPVRAGRAGCGCRPAVRSFAPALSRFCLCFQSLLFNARPSRGTGRSANRLTVFYLEACMALPGRQLPFFCYLDS